MFTRVKTDQELDFLRESCRIDATILKTIFAQLEPGITGIDLDEMARREIKGYGVKSAYLGFEGYPATICVSINDIVAHGIPSQERIKNGDVVSLDLGVKYHGMVSDMCATVVVGNSSPEKDRLLAGTREALQAGMNVLKDGVRVGDIGQATQEVMQRYGFGIVRDLVGHGVGHEVHEEPSIPHYGHAGTGETLKAGMTICIEPMATLGLGGIAIDDDGWTARTVDGSICAQFEHTILITEDGHEVLTALL